jgi:hypothetical protein
LFSHNVLTSEQGAHFLGGGGEQKHIIEERLTDLNLVLCGVLTDTDHMTPQHRQTTYKALDFIMEKIACVTRKNTIWEGTVSHH